MPEWVKVVLLLVALYAALATVCAVYLWDRERRG